MSNKTHLINYITINMLKMIEWLIQSLSSYNIKIDKNNKQVHTHRYNDNKVHY